MHEILHILGLCHDSFAHFDLMDLLIFIHEYNINSNYGFKGKNRFSIRKKR